MEGPETLTPPATAPAARPSSAPIREDCWSEEATSTLIDAWGERHLELNRGNLRQKHWQEVADAVNARHGAVKKARRTDVQCKNRIDTLKKKYKLEKAKILASGGSVTSKWPFYDRLDALIGPSSTSTPASAKKSVPSPVTTPVSAPPLAVPLQYRKQLPTSLPHATVVPVAPRSAREKRPASAIPVDDSFFRKNYSAVAAAAAAADSGSSRSSTESRQRERNGGGGSGSGGGGGGGGRGEVDGVRELAQAIVRFGEIYEKVEGVKQRQMVELEKQRMEFMKSLEFQRMQLFMDWQVQLEKIKRAKRATSSDTSKPV